MSGRYKVVQWNGHKRVYDFLSTIGVVLVLVLSVAAEFALNKAGEAASLPIALMRALGLCGFTMLHIILAIGPLARLDDRFTPLLYNRRHFGVMFFLIVLLHAVVAVGFYGGFGVQNPLVAVLAGSGRDNGMGGLSFELFGFLALIVFFLMAATSHDFWLRHLGTRFWKAMHMLVYAAYALVVLHVAFGALQAESSPLLFGLVGLGVVLLSALHIASGLKQAQRDRRSFGRNEWVDACDVSEIPDTRARVIRVSGCEPIAVYRDGEAVHAVTNVCAHQGGPLGEGQILDGCVTCPWHGHQFDPRTGCAPAPYTDRVRTYEVRIVNGRVQVSTKSNAGEAHG